MNKEPQQLSWTHYRYILPIKDEKERNYYINRVILDNLSVRDLRREIKTKAFDRLSYADKKMCIRDSITTITILIIINLLFIF